MFKLKERAAILVMLGMAAFGPTSRAQAAYPDHPVHIYLGVAVGGGVDILARLLAAKLSEKWGQPVIVENKAGADGIIAADLVAHAAPDGYTLIFINSAYAIAPAFHKLNFDPVKSFNAIISPTYVPHLIAVHPSVPAKTLAEFVAYAKSKPGELNYGSTGTADATYLETEAFMRKVGISMVNVPFKGGSESTVALLAGQVQFDDAAMPSLLGPSRAGQINPLAVFGQKRSPAMPDVPTIGEATGVNEGLDITAWNGLLAPAGTPPEICAKLEKDISDVIKEPEMNAKLANLSYVVTGDGAKDFASRIESDIARWKELVASLNINP